MGVWNEKVQEGTLEGGRNRQTGVVGIFVRINVDDYQAYKSR